MHVHIIYIYTHRERYDGYIYIYTCVPVCIHIHLYMYVYTYTRCIYNMCIYIYGQTRYHAFWPISILTWYAARTPVRFRIPEQFSNGSALMMHSWAAVALWVKSNWGSSVLHHIMVLGITLFEVIFGLPRFLWRYTLSLHFLNAQKRPKTPSQPLRSSETLPT